MIRLGSLDETYDEQHDDGADRCVNDGAEDAPDGEEPRQQEAGNDGTNDADHDIANETETASGHDLTGKPTSDRTDNQEYDKSR